MKVTVVGAGSVGSSCAEYLAIKDIADAVSYTHLTLPTTPYV